MTTVRMNSLSYRFIFLLVLAFTGCNGPENTPEPVKGRLDLGELKFQKTSFIHLKGEWEFYWNQLAGPGTDFTRLTPAYSNFPEIWNKSESTDVGKTGFATYRLVISAAEFPELLMVKFGDQATAFRLYANGELIAGNGKVGTSPETSAPQFLPGAGEFSVKGREIEILLQISNYHYYEGGAWNDLLIGSKTAIDNLTFRSIGLDLFLLGSFLVMSVYHFGLFFMRKKELNALYFAIISLLLSVRSIFLGERFLIRNFNEFPWELELKIEFASLYLVVLFFTMFFEGIFKNSMNKRVYQATIAVCTLFTLSVIPFDALVFSSFLDFFLAGVSVLILYTFYIIARGLKDNTVYARIYAAGYAVFAVTVLNDALKQAEIIRTPEILPLGFLFFVYVHAIILSVKFSRSLTDSEILAENLLGFDKMKDELLANTSHELKTPLNGIIGLTHSLLDGASGELNQLQKKNLGMVYSSASRLSGLVNDILDYSRLKHTDISLHLESVNLGKLVEAVIVLLSPLAIEKDLVIENNLPGDLPNVMGDANRIQQIFYNLLGNAIKFTDVGTIEIDGELNNQLVEICILDSGIGISAAKLEQIFNRYEQNVMDIDGKYTGTGLGLSITKKLVTLHGGTIQVESDVGKGTRLCFSLPVAVGGLAESKILIMENSYEKLDTGVSPVPGKNSKGHFILVTDDEPVNLHVVSGFLENEGYEIVTARNGQEALDAISRRLPDLLLLDIMLPDTSGYEICKMLRKEHTFVDLPIIFTTARTGKDDMVAGLLAGANDYITKPVDKRELLARINTHLELKNSLREKEYLISLQQELNIARSIQESILPQTFPVISGMDLHIKYLPMSTIGGDYYDIYSGSPDSIGIFMADVTGHGVPSALIASMLCILFTQNAEKVSNPPELLSIINGVLASRFKNQYVTAGCMYINTSTGKLLYSRAGHPALMIYRRTEDRFFYLLPKGRIMGWNGDITCDIAEMDLVKGDRIILYTDGIVECMDLAKNVYGQDRLEEEVRLLKDFAPEEMTDMLIDKLEVWNNNSTFDDDMAIAVVDITE